MYQRGLSLGAYQDLPRLSFWIQLCRSASLLDEARPPYPTLFAADWFAYPLENQIWTLVHAWLSAPGSKRRRLLRQRLLDKLLADEELSPTYRRELNGLRAIGICEGDELSFLGKRVLGERIGSPSYVSRSSSWQIAKDRLQVPYPPQWDLIWQLETYLDPVEPGVYSLTPGALRRAVQRNALDGLAAPTLITILAKGLGKPPPAELMKRLAVTPRLRILTGPVLEFDDPQELIRLREMTSLRQKLQQILSPRHVHLDPWEAPAVLSRLYRLGLLAERDLESRSLNSGLSHEKKVGRDDGSEKLSKADCVQLLSILLLAEGIGSLHAPPPGLMVKLTVGLDSASRGAAARKATELLEIISPEPIWIPEEEPPPQPAEELLAFLDRAIAREESIDVIYHTHGRKKSEYRHLTPLLVEQRGPRYYLIAYCHTRRANRTFRLDRLRLIDYPPEL